MGKSVAGKLIRLGLFLALALAPTTAAKERTVTRTGWLSDENCGARHTKPGGTDCIQKCMRGGQDIGHPEWKPQRAVFVADADKKVWVVENAEAVRGGEGRHIRLTGRFDADRKSVRVTRVVALEEEKK